MERPLRPALRKNLYVLQVILFDTWIIGKGWRNYKTRNSLGNQPMNLAGLQAAGYTLHLIETIWNNFIFHLSKHSCKKAWQATAWKLACKDVRPDLMRSFWNDEISDTLLTKLGIRERLQSRQGMCRFRWRFLCHHKDLLFGLFPQWHGVGCKLRKGPGSKQLHFWLRARFPLIASYDTWLCAKCSDFRV